MRMNDPSPLPKKCPRFFNENDSRSFFLKNLEGKHHPLESKLPLFQWFFQNGHLSLHFICRHRLNIGKFFYEMIHRWLLPGKQLDETFFFSSDFKWLELGPHLYNLAEMIIRLDQIGYEHIQHNLRIIETEIRLGMVSIYHASRLLEAPFLTTQEKNGIVQEKISKLIQRYPEKIDYDIFGELQYFMVMSKEEFKAPRTAHHLSRLVALFYLFRKSIEKNQGREPDKRHIRIKLAKVQLEVPWGMKKALGICVGLNLLHSNELFEERHLIRALQNGVFKIKIIPDSFFINEGIEGGIRILYLEIEQENEEIFNRGQLKQFQLSLLKELKQVIEISLSSLFMPRNEEEIIRHIITLSRELRFIKDPPQLILMFDEQKNHELYFTIILVRVIYPHTPSIQTLIENKKSFLQYIPDRIKRVGMLRKRYPKEATVFRVKLLSDSFLRDDHSVDIFKARQEIVQELQQLIGGIRDYTGGMIAKQIELLNSLHDLIGTEDHASRRLLESFFHAIYPVEARSTLSPTEIKPLFLLWNSIIPDPHKKKIITKEGSTLYIIGRSPFMPEIDPTDFIEMQLITVRPELDEKFLGYLFFSQEEAEQEKFLSRFK